MYITVIVENYNKIGQAGNNEAGYAESSFG